MLVKKGIKKYNEIAIRWIKNSIKIVIKRIETKLEIIIKFNWRVDIKIFLWKLWFPYLKINI